MAEPASRFVPLASGPKKDVPRLGAGLLVVLKRDRLARDLLKAGAIEAHVAASGGRVVSADGVADGDDPASRLLRQLLDAFSEFERQLIRERTRAAPAAKKARGELVGKPPLGCRLAEDGRTLLACPKEALTIERARELRAGGLTLRAVVVRLTEEGHISRAGRQYSLHSVQTMCG